MKYIKLYNQIKARIKSGKYAVNTKIPHIKELAKSFKVSDTTLQRAIKMLEREGILIGIPSKGTFVRNLKEPSRYADHKNMIRLAVPTMQTIGHAMDSPYYFRCYQGIEDSVLEKGGSCFPVSCRERSVHDIIRQINALEINNMITVGFDNGTQRRELEKLSIPIAHADLIDLKCTKPMICGDNLQGGALVLRKLTQLGHKKILFIHGYVPSLKRREAAGVLRWKGISGYAEQKGLRYVKHEVVTYEQDQREKQTAAALKKHNDCTGLVFSDGSLFNEAKKALEKRPQADTRKMDFIVFSLFDTPAVIHRKPVWYCKWDGRKMGDIAAKTLLDKSRSYPKIQHIPMYLDRNL
jgi:DNA-binding LacI/PurR family transcriptional regulator